MFVKVYEANNNLWIELKRVNQEDIDKFWYMVDYLMVIRDNYSEMRKAINKNYNKKNKKYDEYIHQLEIDYFRKMDEVWDIYKKYYVDEKLEGRINYNNEKYKKVIIKGKRVSLDKHGNLKYNDWDIFKCPVCGQLIISFDKKIKYCSKECRESSRDERGKECMNMFKESYYSALNRAKELAGNKSELSGKKGKLIVHHLNSYNKDLSGRCDVANMVVLLEEEHIAFHKKYGYGNNSVEQFEEFMCDYVHA